MKTCLSNALSLAILGAILTTLTGCSKNDNTEALSNITSTFYVSKIEGNSTINNIDQTFLLPTSKLYNFKTCLKDIMQSKAIIGQSFKISGDGKTVTAYTDDDGCLNWSEDFEYNFISKSSFVKITKTITATGIHKGALPIEMAINPWSHGENQTRVIDVSKEAVVASLEVNQLTKSTSALELKTDLKILEPRITITERDFNSAGASMQLKFQNKIGIDLLNSSNQKVQYILNSGNFNIELSLFNTFLENGKEVITPLAVAKVNNKNLLQDYLVTESIFTLKNLPNKGQLLLGVKITTVENNLGLGSAEGVFLVSEGYNIKVDKTPSLMGSMTLSELNSHINGHDQEIKSEVSNKNNIIKPGIEIDRLELRFLRIGQESTTTRQVFFTVKACLKNNLDSRPIRDLSLIIKTYSGKMISTLKTNQDGCILWDDSVWHKYFAQEQYLKGTISIKNSQYNINSTINIGVNPWVAGLNFGRDTRFDNDLGTANITASNSSSKIVIEDYSFNTTQYQYEINNNLELSMVKKGRLSINARIINPSSTNEGRGKNDFLRPGKYLLKWAVVTVDKDENAKSLISSGEKIVDAVAGDIKSDLSFKISAFKFLNDRSRFVMAVYAVDELKLQKNPTDLNNVINRNSGLISTPYISTIVLNSDEERERAWSLDHKMGLASNDIFDGLAKLEKAVNSTKDLSVLSSSSEKQVLKSHELEKIDLAQTKIATDFMTRLIKPNEAELYKSTLSSQNLNEAVKNGTLSTDLASRFCRLWFQDHINKKLDVANGKNRFIEAEIESLTRDCLHSVRKDPNSFFSIDKKIMAKKIGNVVFKGGQTYNINVGNSFYISKADSKTFSKTWSWTNSVGFKFEFLKIFSFGSQAGYALARASSSSDTSTNSGAVSMSTNLLLQRNTYSLELQAYNHCLAIKLNPELFSGVNARYKNYFSSITDSQERSRVVSSGFFICNELNQKPIQVDESYHLVSQDRMYGGGIIDAHDLANHQLFMSFRGDRDLTAFLSLIQGTVQSEKGKTSIGLNLQSREKLSNDFMKGLPSWPGAYSAL